MCKSKKELHSSLILLFLDLIFWDTQNLLLSVINTCVSNIVLI